MTGGDLISVIFLGWIGNLLVAGGLNSMAYHLWRKEYGVAPRHQWWERHCVPLVVLPGIQIIGMIIYIWVVIACLIGLRGQRIRKAHEQRAAQVEADYYALLDLIEYPRELRTK